MNNGVLYIVATPIGNLDDLPARAVSTLREVDCILAEDTRHSRKLLQHYGVQTHMESLHEHSEDQRAPGLVDRLKAGQSLALISDAGTPLLSDPGYRLVSLAAKAGIRVSPVPGPSAVTAALSVSGLPSDRFCFEGFLPASGAGRRARLSELEWEQRTIVFFETGQRLRSSLADLAGAFGPDRPAVICRELTKRFETILRGSLQDLSEQVAQNPDQSRGEIVLLVGGNPGQAGSIEEACRLASLLTEDLSSSTAARIAARYFGVPRRQVYDALQNETC